MEIDRRRDKTSSSSLSPEGVVDGGAAPSREANGLASPSTSSTSSFSSSSSISSASGLSCIEHRVSKLDTLAGVAIKYGVEVTDIKKINGLVTDIQMFAHKSLQIPLPGRHPPSPCISSGSSCIGKKVSAAMKSLQGYYGLTPPRRAPPREVNRGDDPHPGHRRSSSLVNGFAPEDAEREAAPPPELLLKEDDQGGAFSASSSGKKGLALRQKAGNWRPETAVRKSSSASDLQDADGGGGGSAARGPPGRWTPSKSDGKGKTSTLDGIPRPMAVWKNKAAMD